MRLRLRFLQQWFFGMEPHISFDANSGLVHTVVACSLLHRDEEVVYRDPGYQGLAENGSHLVTVFPHLNLWMARRTRLAEYVAAYPNAHRKACLGGMTPPETRFRNGNDA